MKVECFITPEMEQVSEKSRETRIEYEKKISEAGIYIRRKAILTAGIVLYIFENSFDEGLSAWAFYPKTGLEDYISSAEDDSEIEDFYNRAIDRLLKNHNWHNPDVETVVNYRKEHHLALHH